MLFIIGVVVYWNRKLAKEIILRKEAENQTKTVLNSIPLQVMITSVKGDLLSANPQALNDYNIHADEFDQHNISEFYADISNLDTIIKEIREKGKVEQKTISMKQSGGTLRSMMASVTPINYQEKPALLSVAVDMTERIEMEAALQDAKEKIAKENNLLNSIMSSTNDLIFYKDKNLNYFGANSAFLKFIGKTEKELLGHNDFYFFDKKTAEQFRYHDLNILKNKVIHTNEETISDGEGNEKHLLTQKIPFLYDNENMGVLGITSTATSKFH